MVLQKNIKQQLNDKKLSVAELERRIGIKHAVVNILHGRSKNPSIRVTHAIATELGCSVEELLTSSEQVVAPINDKSSSWDPKLGTDVVDAVNKFILDNDLHVCIDKVLFCINEIYSYIIEDTDKQIDYRFVKWICERNLK